MARLIDADELLNKTENLEAVALEQVCKYEPSENPIEWHRWSSILRERSAFRYDLMDAPTIDAEPIRHGHWIYKEYCLPTAIAFYKCSVCSFTCGFDADNYCPHCGAKMDGEGEQ